MKTTKTKNKGVTEASDRNARLSSVETLLPHSGNSEKPGRSTLLSRGLEASAARPIVTLSHEQITERARALWIQHGCPQDRDEANWHEAEAQLRAEL